MRDIKLRFWDKENNYMVYQDKNGLYPNSFYKIECDLFTDFQFKLFRLSKLNQFSESLNRFEEVESAKMQWTGTKDSNDKEIYEGDIVEIEDYFGEDLVGKVLYDEKEACYWIMKGNERSYFMITFDLESYVHTVIGNIFENPELLERVD